MSELEEVFQDFKEEYGVKHCTVCLQPTAMRDAIGFPWCAEHEQHGKVLSWGRRHNYPELDLYTHRIGPGEFLWWCAVRGSAATSFDKGDEAFMWTALAYIENIDSQEVAS